MVTRVGVWGREGLGIAPGGRLSDFASSQTAREWHQNPENKVFTFWTLFWEGFGYPFGSILAPFWSPWEPFGALWLPMGSILVPIGYPFGTLWHLIGACGVFWWSFGEHFKISGDTLGVFGTLW